MARKASAGFIKKKEIWHIDKYIGGKRVCQSTKTSNLEEAEKYLAKLMEESRQAEVYGVRPERSFQEAAEKYLSVKSEKKSIGDDQGHIKYLLPWIGDITINKIHMGTLQPWIESRKSDGVKTNTINHGLKVVRQILNCAVTWIDDYNLTWLVSAPKIQLLPVTDQKPAYPLDWKEQEILFSCLAPHLRDMALFAVNTGCRDQEVCNLKWEWEFPIPDLDTSVFIIPKEFVKNSQDRLVVLNSEASEVVDKCRGIHPTHVFTYQGKPVTRMMSSGWKNARKKVGLPNVRVHDLKHSFGRRLRAANVSFEDRQDLLGHKSTRVTTHYSEGDLISLIEAAEKVCVDGEGKKPALLILRRAS
jgi:integrase